MKYNEFVKRAGIYTDMAKAVPGNLAAAAIGLGNMPQFAGEIGGYVAGNPGATYDQEWKKWAPLSSQMGIIGQRRALSKRYGNDKDTQTVASERWGGVTAGIGAALLGAAIGGTAGGIAGGSGEAALAGAGFGGLAGAAVSGVGELTGTLAALLKRTRTKEEQKAYEQGSHTSNWLVPGKGTYNAFKAYGRLHADQNEEEEAVKNKKKNNG